jgi:hypothetical protein
MKEHLTSLNANRLFDLASKTPLKHPATDVYEVTLALARAAMGADPGTLLPSFRLFAKELRVIQSDVRLLQAVTVHEGKPDGGVLLGGWYRSDLPSVNASLFIGLGKRLERIYGLR